MLYLYLSQVVYCNYMFITPVLSIFILSIFRYDKVYKSLGPERLKLVVVEEHHEGL